MTDTATTNEISDLNLTYLLLAQRLVREDVATAMFRLGLSREVADLLGNLSVSQIVKLAASSPVGTDAGRKKPSITAGTYGHSSFQSADRGGSLMVFFWRWWGFLSALLCCES